MKKYLLSIICTLLPIFASAQEPYAILIDEGTALEFRYDNNRSSYPDAMSIGPFASYSDRGWHDIANSIYSVVFDPSFANYTSLTSTAWWFSNCRNLETVLGIEYLNTSNVTSMRGMFNWCTNLTSIDVSHFDTSKATDIAFLFSNCSSLTSLDVSNFNTSNVTVMEEIFGYCSSLTSLDVSSFNTSKVTVMGNIFEGCSGLTSLDVSNFDTSSAYFMEEFFRGCTGLTSLDISNFNTANVVHMDQMFQDCSNLLTIYVGADWSTANVTESDNMFTGCTSLVGESGTTYDSNHTDAEYARVDMASSPGYFTYKNGGSSGDYWMELESTLQYADDVYARARDNSNVEPWMLEELSEFMNRGSDMLDAHEADEQEVRHMIEEINYICWEIEEAMNREPEPSGEAEPYAVLSNEGLVVTFYYDNQKDNRGGIDLNSSWTPNSPYETATTAVIDDSFASYSPTSTAYWFCGCRNITSISGIENINTENVTSMLGMFQGCSHLTEINVSGFNTSSVGEMGSMFEACSDLTTLDLSSFNTANVTGMSYMFANSMSLRTIYVSSSWSITSVTNSADMFSECYSLVGGRGTEFSQDYTGVDYAHIDGGTSNPGYLTDINAEPTEGEARFDGLTAWVYGDATLDDAFAEVGREEALKTIAAIVWEGNGELTSEQMQGITNPNLLVYVNEASKAPAGVQNVIVNGTAAQIVLTDASGNNNFFCPEPFTAQSISYTRNFSQTTEIGVSRGWETIALPFNVQSISHGSHGALVPFGGGNGGYPFWLHQLLSNGLTPVTAMEANTPYLICMPNNTVYPSAYNQAGSVTFASSNVTVPRTEPREAFGANVILMPAFQNQPAGPDIFTLNVGAARDSYAEGSVFISNYSDVRPFQAYVHHSNQARGTDDIQFIPLTSIGGGDDTTAIMEIIQPAANGTGDWYSLDGRKLSSKPTQKGVYIQNGKKIVIK